MAFGFLSANPQQNQQQGIGALRPGPNYQLGQQGWMTGYGNPLPMTSGDHMPLVSASQSHRPPQQAMAPGQPQQRLQQPGPQQPPPGGGGGPVANEPWNSPGWVQPMPTYNNPAWGSNAIGWGGSGSAPPAPTVDPVGPSAIGAPLPPAPAIAAGSGGPGSVGAGMPAGQWQAIIQALSGLGSNMFGAAQAGDGNYSNPNYLNSLLNGLGQYQ